MKKKLIILISLIPVIISIAYVIKINITFETKQSILNQYEEALCNLMHPTQKKICDTKKNLTKLGNYFTLTQPLDYDHTNSYNLLTKQFNDINRNNNGVSLEGFFIASSEALALKNQCNEKTLGDLNCLDYRVKFLEKISKIPQLNKISNDIKLQPNYIKAIKQIDLPGDDFNWNPSIIAYNNHYLMTFRANRNLAKLSNREIHNRDDFFDNSIYIAEFDKNFNLITKKQNISQYIPGCTDKLCTAQDARLFEFNNNIYVFYNVSESFSYNSERINKIAKLVKKGNNFILEDFRKISLPFLPSKKDKNWMPLVHNNKLLIIYLTEPKTITLELNLDNGFTKIYSEKNFISDYKFGLIRGSTSFSPLEDNEYITFFHSVLPFQLDKTHYTHYYMSSLTLKCDKDCEVSKIATTPLLPFFSSYDSNNLSVTFPSGLLVTKDEIIITAGKGDESSYVIILDKQKYLENLVKARNLTVIDSKQ